MGLSTKLVLSVVAGLLAVLAFLGYLGFQAVRESTDRTMNERLTLAQMVARDIDLYISQRLGQLRQIAPELAPSLQNGRLADIEEALEQLYRYGGPYTQSTFLLDATGQIVYTVPAGSEPPQVATAYYPGPLESVYSSQSVVSAVVSYPSPEGLMVTLVVPVIGPQGERLGILGATLGPTPDFLRSLLNPFKLGETGYAQVVNERGLVMATSTGYQDNAFPVTAHADRFSELIQKGQGGVWTCHRCHDPEGEGDRRQDVMAFAPLSAAPWGVAIRQDKDEAFGPRDDLQRKFLISGTVALALALGAALVAGRTLSRPLRRLAAACQRIAAGDLEEPVTVSGKDEIGQLGAAFELMRQRLRQSRQELEEHSRALATLEERNRIAREMHDSLSQVLSYIRLTAGAAEERLAQGDPAAARDKLREVRGAARDAYEDVRQGILALRAGGTLEEGLLPALERFLEQYRAQTGLVVTLRAPDQWAASLSQAAQVQLLRIIQEALANIRKHARAQRVEIDFSHRGGWLQVSATDDGQGFDPTQATQEGGRFGLQTMRERAESVGGTFAIQSRPGAGTRVIVRLPLPSKEGTWSP